MSATREDDQAKRHRLGLVAAQGDADAQCVLGVMHHDGQGGPVHESTKFENACANPIKDIIDIVTRPSRKETDTEPKEALLF